MNKIFIFILLTMFSASSAFAGSIIEPYAGAFINSTYDFNDGAEEGDISGTAVGVRVGFQQMGFMAGLDGRRLFTTFEPDSGDDTDYTFSQLGFFVGYNLPVMLRFWGEYIFSLEGSDNDDSDNQIKKGSGYLLGLGYRFFPFLSLNLEYSSVTATEFETSAGSSDIDTKTDSLLVSISLPLDF